MTNERDNEARDQLVSDTYRSLASETTPEALNQSVLKMAADASTSGDSRHPLFAIWMKPVAWAATIGLTLTIALQFTEIPTEIAQPAPAVQSAAKESMSNDMGRPNRPREEAQLRSDSTTMDSSHDEAIITIDLKTQKAKRQVDDYAASAPGMAQILPKTQDAPAAAMLEEAEAAIQACDDTARKSAESWFTCIQDLRNAGETELANMEYLALKDKYPTETAKLEANK
jgi:hypothetical protein